MSEVVREGGRKGGRERGREGEGEGEKSPCREERSRELSIP